MRGDDWTLATAPEAQFYSHCLPLAFCTFWNLSCIAFFDLFGLHGDD
jgi:hypothetical protein